MTESKKGLRIIQLIAENVKKIRVVNIKPDGSMIQITGANGSGKSSVLDSIWWALSGASVVTSMPIRKGADRAVIKLEMGDISVTRRFAKGEDGKADSTSLVVESVDGARYPSPQKMLDELLGALAFDPLEFSRMDQKAQLNTLRSFVPLDVDVDALDREHAALYQKRTDIGRRGKEADGAAKRLLGQIDNIDMIPDVEIDIVQISRELGEIERHNAGITTERARRNEMDRTISDLHAKVADIDRQIEELVKTRANWAQTLKATEDAFASLEPLPEPKESGEVYAAMTEARRVNAEVVIKKNYLEAKANTDNIRNEYQAISKVMEDIQSAKRTAFAGAKMPIPGLAFGDDEVLFNDVPFSQASSAEQLRISTAMAMAMNPKLRVLRIKDGSLLDESNLALLQEMADANDFQVWIERVDTSGAVGVVMEDGMVANDKPALVQTEDIEPEIAGA